MAMAPLGEAEVARVAAEALAAAGLSSGGEDEVAERLMSVVRWRSRPQQQQQAHEQADGAVVVATDRAALLRALCEAAGRGNEAMALRLMVAVDVTTQGLRASTCAEVGLLVSLHEARGWGVRHPCRQLDVPAPRYSQQCEERWSGIRARADQGPAARLPTVR